MSGQTIPSTDPPIVTTTDGGATWTRQTSGAGTGNYLHAVSCLPGTTTCTAVGRGGKIVTTTNLTTWTAATSNTTNMLNSVLCLSTSFCIAVGQNGTVDVWNGSTWTATTGNGGTGMLADVDCQGNLVCYATGKQGVTLLTTDRRHELDAAGRRRDDAADERHLLHERRARATRPATPGRS